MNKTVIIAGMVLAALWGAVTFISLGIPPSVCGVLRRFSFGLFDGAVDNMKNGFYYDVSNLTMPTVAFLALFSMAFFLYLFVSLRLFKKVSTRKTFFLVAFFSLLFRLILLPSVPIHENDFYRYFWDGKALLGGVNPYKYAPGALESGERPGKTLSSLKNLRQENPVFFNRIGHRAVPTIYPPLAQGFFAFSNFVKKDSLITLKTLLIFFDMSVFFLIARLLEMIGRSASGAIIYGWSPLVLKEFANSAHYDSIPIFLMLLFLYYLLRKEYVMSSLTLACAGLTKFFPLVLAPVFAGRIRKKYLLFALAVFTTVYIPFFVWDKAGIGGVFGGLMAYSRWWAYNGSIFTFSGSLLNGITGSSDLSFTIAKVVSGCAVAGVASILMMRKENSNVGILRKSFLMLSALFLLSPVGDPWYFCWVVPFLCIFPYRSFLLLSWLLIFSYLTFNHDFGDIRVGAAAVPVIILIQYIPFYLTLFIEFSLQKRRKRLAYV